MSEPTTKIVKLDSVSGPLSQSKMEDAAGVSIFLCSDILLEVLRCLTRCQIIKLESAGGRIHRIVKSCLKREPYITRFLELKPGPNDGLEAKISKSNFEIYITKFRDISHTELGLFLRCCEFLRFENVKLSYYAYGYGSQSIDKKCHLFVKHLKPLKTAFSDSTRIEFDACVGGGQRDFSDFRTPHQLLNHLRNELLPVCDSARRYEFTIRFCSHWASTANILKSMLQMPPINSSTNVQLNLYQWNVLLRQLLPVDAISAWLDRSNDMVMKYKQQQKTPLELSVDLNEVVNAHELFEHFKKTFNKAESPRQPFILSLSEFYGVLQSETLSNEKTNEELSIEKIHANL